MSDYSYIDKTGASQTTTADTPEAALSSAKNIASDSGVQLLSTESGANAVTKGVDKLNQYSPATDPNYKAPETPKDTKLPVAPKAYFTNENGQEVEFTEAQLKDPNNQTFLNNGGYVQSKTEFNTDFVTSKDTNINTQKDAITKLGDYETTFINDMLNYNVDKDPEFQSQVNDIKGQFSVLKDAMAKTNASRAASFSSLGLRTGATQYAGGVQLGIEGEELNQANQRINDINRQESLAISAARKAQKEGKWTEFNNKINAIDKLRTNKATELEDYSKKLNAAVTKANEEQVQASKDSAISDFYKTGITDPSAIMSSLKQNGTTMSLKDINDSLKNIIPAGLDDLIKTARQNGATPEVLKKILSSTDINAAYDAAGAYGAGGTGDIGKYNFYKAQAISKGLNPVDPNTFWNWDANRKDTGGNGGTTYDENGNVIQTGNYDALTIGRYNKAVNAATAILQKNPTFKNIVGSSAYLDRIEAAIKNPGSVGDQELLDAFTQLNTGGNRVTEAQVHLITSNQSFADMFNKWSNKLKNGGALSDAQRQEIVKLSQEVYKNYQKSYKPLYADAVARLKKQGIPEEFWNLPSPDTLSRAVNDAGSTGDNILQIEQEADTSLQNYIKSNPAKGVEIANLIKQMEDAVGHSVNSSDFLARYPQYK